MAESIISSAPSHLPACQTTLSEKVSSKNCADSYPEANIVAIDYDPGASEVNQLNRIKLMLSTADRRIWIHYEKYAPRISQVIAAVAKVSCKNMGFRLVAGVTL